jgi:type II secretory pathway component PulF
MGYIPVMIRENREGLPILAKLYDIFERITPQDMIVFSRQLATLIGAGLPFTTSFETLINQTENKKFRDVLSKVKKDVEGGSSFSEALAKHPKVFSSLYVSMIRAGETGGVLDEILTRIARLAEHEAEMRQRVKSATRYPLIVIVTIVIAFVVLITTVVPKFATIYSGFHVKLPLPTRILIGVSNAIQHDGFLMLGGIVLGIWGILAYVRTEKGRLLWDRIKLKIPVFGPLFLKVAMSRFARTFGTLVRSGLPLIQTLEIVATTVGNVVLERVIADIRESARSGRGIVQPMRISKAFPPMVVQMVAVGEETGKLEEMLFKVSDYYDMEVEYAIRNLSTALEPLLLLFIGGMVLILALGIFLPWWDLISVFKG